MSELLAPIASRFRRASEVRLAENTPRRGNRVTRAVAIFLLALWGWRVTGYFPTEPKLVLVGAPHTSNWDMVLGMVVMYAVGFRMTFMAKHTAFRWPFGGLVRWLGATPVDRRAAHGLVEQMVKAFQEQDSLLLAILPEGTRSHVQRWKTGFYHIACGANVPLLFVKFNYGARVVEFGPTFRPTGDLDRELPQIKAHFRGAVGKRPENAAPLA